MLHLNFKKMLAKNGRELKDWIRKISFLKKKGIRIISNHKNHNKNGNPEIWGERESDCFDRENSEMILEKHTRKSLSESSCAKPKT